MEPVAFAEELWDSSLGAVAAGDPAALAKCTLPNARPARKKSKYPSSPRKGAPCTAMNTSSARNDPDASKGSFAARNRPQLGFSDGGDRLTSPGAVGGPGEEHLPPAWRPIMIELGIAATGIRLHRRPLRRISGSRAPM